MSQLFHLLYVLMLPFILNHITEVYASVFCLCKVVETLQNIRRDKLTMDKNDQNS